MANAATVPLIFEENPLKLILGEDVEAVKFVGTKPDVYWPNTQDTTPPVSGPTVEALVKFRGRDIEAVPFYLVQPAPIVEGETLLVEGFPQTSTR